MTAIYAVWMVEFILEACGAYLYSSRSKMLSFLLAVCALGDLVTVFILQIWPQSYGTAFWWFYLAKYFALLWLGCSICGMFVSANKKSVTVISAGMLSLGAAALITAFSVHGENLKARLLDAEISANMLLLAMVIVGFIGRSAYLKTEWKWITAGFILMVGSDLIFTALWTFWDGARHWYPLGAVSAQIVWIAGPLRKVKLPYFRQSLGQKIQDAERISVC